MNSTRIGRRAAVSVAAAIAVTAIAGFAIAQDRALELTMVRQADLHFVAMPNGTYQARVVGDVDKPGPYAARTRLPAGLRIPPHFHPEERIVLVMSGTLLVGYGGKFDETKMTALPPGSVFTEPRKQPHFTWAKDGEVILHVTGTGPSATTWLDRDK
ncbi:MAG TPA: cupin domain-containing protein [Vicinamibacterales bacterium]|jgi:quercetin dioxygenase-like cupin family protein